MLQSLNSLASKISPDGIGMLDANANKVGHRNRNVNDKDKDKDKDKDNIGNGCSNSSMKCDEMFPSTPYKRILVKNIINNNNNNATNNNVHYNNIQPITRENITINESQDEPDSDYIKMFVGQIPRNMDEENLKNMFSEYGRVHTINILRDKQTGQSKGCCFLTYYTRRSALDAQNALHNIKTLPGMHHPIQIKPADSENRNERKLFVGMLAKKCNEADIRQMFENFGGIEECTVLRDNNGNSKGCAFVTYTSKQCAINAIKTMHQSHTMEGCSSPLVVKFADTQKDKDQKKIQQMQSNMWNIAGLNMSQQAYLALTHQLASSAKECAGPACLSPLQMLQQQLQVPSANNCNYTTTSTLSGLLLHNSPSPDLHSLSASALNLNGSCQSLSDISPISLHNITTLANLSMGNAAANSPLNTAVNPIHVQNLMSLAAITGANSLPNTGLLGGNASSTGGLNALSSNSVNGISLGDLSSSLFNTNVNRELAANAAGKQIGGPDGANLFIYHLPQECTDVDLASMFIPFGNVISAKVFIDKHTNLSKCFGFVSYDNASSAESAIQNMNCFQIGTKRLKVQHKRAKDSSKPY